MDKGVLTMTRFSGPERYPIRSATWRLLPGDGTEDDPDLLSLCLTCGPGVDLPEDTARLGEEPLWEVTFSGSFSLDALAPGLRWEQPNDRGDVDGLLTYGEHQPTFQNVAEVLATDGERLRIHLTGITEDVNFYDGSKPKTALDAAVWFDPE